MARNHPKHGPCEDLPAKDEAPATVVLFWLRGRSTGKTVVWHHPVPKSRGGSDVVPMQAICQQTLLASFSNSELQRHGMNAEGLLANPKLGKFG